MHILHMKFDFFPNCKHYAEDIKKRWQEYTEELYITKIFNPDNHDGVITHLQPDILECEVKWALETLLRTKLVEVMEFQLSYFKPIMVY